MPLPTFKYPVSHPPLENQHNTFLHIGCDPKAKWTSKPDCATFGFAPMMYQHDVGTHLVASATMEHLSAETVEASCNFCQWYLMSYVQKHVEKKAAAVTAPKLAKLSKHVLNQMTNAKWTTRSGRPRRRMHPPQRNAVAVLALLRRRARVSSTRE